MLIELRVRDLAVISDVTLRLGAGLNVITGETGAGKSILIDALALLLGERANADLLRPGAARAVVEAAFEVNESSPFLRVADEAGVEVEEGQLLIRRELNAEGRNRAWANGSPTILTVLGTIGELLVDLHGQHESQSLLRAATQRDILDAFGDAGVERREIRECFERAQEIRKQEEELVARRDEVRTRSDYLRHVVREIELANPQPEEDDALTREIRQLSHAEELSSLSERLALLLDGEPEGAASAQLADAQRLLAQLERIDPGVSPWRELLEAASTAVSELAREAEHYASTIEMDPGRLAEAEQRRDTLYRLTQKYGTTIEEVIGTLERAQEELSLLDTAEFDLQKIGARRVEADQNLLAVAGRLTAKRVAAINKITDAVGALLPSLGMPDGKVFPEVTASESPGPTGADTVVFKAQLNPGIDARPLKAVASGGELSRIMLALKVVLAQHDQVPTLVFDEVDEGIGGEIGLQVADALSRVAKGKQVLVITHLPQIAARANHHILVGKETKKGIATTVVRELQGDERIGEIARMLGNADDPVLRQHAEELVGRQVW
jgi:DNA repair protein RecN (Recombination protein N)